MANLAKIGVTEAQFNLAADAEWKRFDLDNNGLIDRTELVAATRSMLAVKFLTNQSEDQDGADDFPEASLEQVQQLFDQLDTDHDGKLDANEFKFFTARLLANMRSAEVRMQQKMAESCGMQ